MEHSGALNRRVEIWRKTYVKGDYGGLPGVWESHKYVRAFNKTHYGHQEINKDELFNAIKIRLVIRNQSDIKPSDRIKINDIMYNIELIQPDYTSRWLTIHCSRIQD